MFNVLEQEQEEEYTRIRTSFQNFAYLSTNIFHKIFIFIIFNHFKMVIFFNHLYIILFLK